MNYDVIIIGAGSMGMAAGYFLSTSGKKTLLLDACTPPHNKGSHQLELFDTLMVKVKNMFPLSLEHRNYGMT